MSFGTDVAENRIADLFVELGDELMRHGEVEIDICALRKGSSRWNPS